MSVSVCSTADAKWTGWCVSVLEPKPEVDDTSMFDYSLLFVAALSLFLEYCGFDKYAEQGKAGRS